MVSHGKTLPMYNTKSEKVKRSVNKVVNINDAGEYLKAFQVASLLIYGVTKI